MEKKEYTYKDFLKSEETKSTSQSNVQPYKPSEAVTQAQTKLNQYAQSKPAPYQSQWQTSLNDTLNKILNREKFSYDMNADVFYNQYKNQHITQGQLAAMDTMGQAQSMTGGYGNSYAQTAGQQAYHGHLQQLNDKAPELYQLALNQYNREGDDLYTQYGLFADREGLDYGRYRDQLTDYNAELGRLTDDSRYQSETDYNRYMDQYNQGLDQFNMSYAQYRDQVADRQWQAEFDEAIRQYNIANGIATGTAAGGAGGGTGTGGTYNAETAAMQEKLNSMGANLTVDGIWGAKTQAAYEKYMAGGTKSDVEAEVREKSAAGDSRNEIMRYINSKYQSGNISESEYVRLMSSYASVGM